MRNIHDIVFADGSVMPRGTVEYDGCWRNDETGEVIYEFREIRRECHSPDSMILNAIIQGVRIAQKEEKQDA